MRDFLRRHFGYSKLLSPIHYRMTKSLSRESGSADGPQCPTDNRSGYILLKGAIILALALAVALLRLYRLGELPPGISQDAGAHGLDALQVLRGEHAVFFPRNFGREGMNVYGTALATFLLGRTVLAIYLPAALASAGTVFAVFWLGQLFFDRDENGQPTPWRALVIGGVAAGLLSVSLSQTFVGRAGVRGNFLPLALSLCLALLWSGWRKRSLWQIALSGACAGLLPYTYIPARFVPFLFLFFGLSFLPSFVKDRTREGKRRGGDISNWLARIASSSKVEQQMIEVFLGCAALVAAPILLHFSLHPDHFFMRSDLVSVFQTHMSQGETLGTFLKNTWSHILAFGFRGDWATRHNIPFRPMLNIWEASFFWFGVAMAGWNIQRSANRLLLLWLLILLLPAALAIGMMPPPSFIRMIGVVPAVYLLIGFGFWESVQLLRRLGDASQVPTNLLSRTYRTGLTVVPGVVIAGLVLIQGVNTYNAYFIEGAANPRFQREFNSTWNDAAQVLNAMPSKTGTVYFLTSEDDMHYGFEYVNFGFEYLYQGAAPAYVFHARTLDLAAMIESTLRKLGRVTDVRLVQFTEDGTHSAHVFHVLDKYGRYLASDKHHQFNIHTFTDVVVDHPWTLYDYLEQLTVHYDGDISLVGFAVGEGERQLSTQHTLSLNCNRSLWVALQWQVHAGLDVDYAVSLRIHDAEGTRVHQNDQWLLLGRLYNAPTSRWMAGEPVDTHINFTVPPDLSQGEYELRLIVYDIKTLNPTVEIDVWEPEVVLTRLRLAECGGK
ncbi:MAG: hypothetical protein F4047_14535 [Caldilineaceae bacterium SB0670_bin_27]|uniref:Glycosyltransferase RgtA/B/C/D-like domain-containing protein n=1 Tax=Caldilineaceae bacterium SB0664_bin_27 TaxID=2605260 RepID=A0A6B0YSB1_9CHLR|nr:hypothetical protein [Caldilineaceae bacterium SB0664_bin_27]MYJ79325.1 hypothetical protein [Caldilineaceae bacterium SB0670_bin_27]